MSSLGDLRNPSSPEQPELIRSNLSRRLVYRTPEVPSKQSYFMTISLIVSEIWQVYLCQCGKATSLRLVMRGELKRSFEMGGEESYRSPEVRNANKHLLP